MESTPTPGSSKSAAPSRGPNRLFTFLAWGVIVVVSIGWVVLNGMRGEEALDGSETSALPALTLQDTLLGRVVVGLHALLPDPSMASAIESQAVVL